MTKESDLARSERFQQALDLFIDRLRGDRYILAVVQVGSFDEQVMWRKEHIGLWIIETDNVTRRLASDGKDERVYRILAEEGINIYAEMIPRSRFKQMVEGASRTAFSCNFFAKRKLVYSADASIESWFERANEVATKDQEKELLTFTTWCIHAHRHAQKRLLHKNDLDMARQCVLDAAHSVAHIENIRAGEICEEGVIYRAIDRDPELFQVIYLDVLAKKNKKTLQASLDTINDYLETHSDAYLKPLLRFLKKHDRVLPLSEISENFAFSQLYPWHLESACEWLARRGQLEKLSAPFRLTAKSREPVEEPAYFFDQ